MILHRSSSASQPLGPFPPLPLAQIPPLFPPTPSVPQPKKPGPDSVQHTSCKSPIDINQAKVCVYDNSSFLSCTALNTQISSSCNCTSEAVCDHSLQILHMSSSSDKPPVWSIAKVASFTSIFSTLSLQGHLAIMDGQANLYVPILAGAIDYLDSEYISSELRSASVKTIANVLATVVAHPRSNLSSLILEPCSASLCACRASSYMPAGMLSTSIVLTSAFASVITTSLSAASALAFRAAAAMLARGALRLEAVVTLVDWQLVKVVGRGGDSRHHDCDRVATE